MRMTESTEAAGKPYQAVFKVGNALRGLSVFGGNCMFPVRAAAGPYDLCSVFGWFC